MELEEILNDTTTTYGDGSYMYDVFDDGTLVLAQRQRAGNKPIYYGIVGCYMVIQANIHIIDDNNIANIELFDKKSFTMKTYQIGIKEGIETMWSTGEGGYEKPYSDCYGKQGHVKTNIVIVDGDVGNAAVHIYLGKVDNVDVRPYAGTEVTHNWEHHYTSTILMYTDRYRYNYYRKKYIYENYSVSDFMSTIAHEAGHIWGIGDIYDDENLPENKPQSIMNDQYGMTRATDMDFAAAVYTVKLKPYYGLASWSDELKGIYRNKKYK